MYNSGNSTVHHHQQQQSFCLKWNNYQSNVTSTFKELLADEDFVDITLTAEGGALKAHKVVLSACSPYFKDILKGISAWQHPVIVLKDVPYCDLQGIVEFIYHGEVSVLQESLMSFLKTAQLLKVKGLTEVPQNNNNEKKKKHHSRKSSRPSKRLCLDDDAVKDDVNSRSTINDDSEDEVLDMTRRPSEKTFVDLPVADSKGSIKSEEEEEIDDVEEEDLEEEEEEEEEEAPPLDVQSSFKFSQSAENGQRHQEHMTGRGDISIATTGASIFTQPMGLSSTFKLLGNNSESGSSAISAAVVNVLANVAAVQNQSLSDNANLAGLSGTTAMGDVSPPYPDAASSQKKTCPYCFQQLSWHALSRHIRDMHRAKAGLVTCKYCFKTFRNKNSLGCHMWRFHKDMRERDQAAASARPPLPSPHQTPSLLSFDPEEEKFATSFTASVTSPDKKGDDN